VQGHLLPGMAAWPSSVCGAVFGVGGGGVQKVQLGINPAEWGMVSAGFGFDRYA